MRAKDDPRRTWSLASFENKSNLLQEVGDITFVLDNDICNATRELKELLVSRIGRLKITVSRWYIVSSSLDVVLVACAQSRVNEDESIVQNGVLEISELLEFPQTSYHEQFFATDAVLVNKHSGCDIFPGLTVKLQRKLGDINPRRFQIVIDRLDD